VVVLAFLVIARLTRFDLELIRGGVTPEAQISKAKADIMAWEVNLIRYKTRNMTLPTQEQGLEALTDPHPNGGWIPIAKAEALFDPWDHQYQYRNPGTRNPNSYDIYSLGPDGIEGTADDIGNW
jgi:general secretion pathway protein G